MLALTSQQVGAFITHVRRTKTIPEEQRNSITVMGCFVSNEENGSAGGAQAVIKTLKEDPRFKYINLRKRPFVSFIEGGGNNYGEPGTKTEHNYTITVAEKGFVGIEIKCEGELGTDSDKNVENIADRVQKIIAGINFPVITKNLPLLQSGMQGYGSLKSIAGKHVEPFIPFIFNKFIGRSPKLAPQVKTTIIPGPRFSEESYFGNKELKALSNQMTPQVEMYFSIELPHGINKEYLKTSIKNIIKKTKLNQSGKKPKVTVAYLDTHKESTDEESTDEESIDKESTVILHFLCKGKAAHAATGSADESAENIATKLKKHLKRLC